MVKIAFPILAITFLVFSACATSIDKGAAREAGEELIVGIDWDRTCNIDLKLCKALIDTIWGEDGIPLVVCARHEALGKSVEEAVGRLAPIVFAAGKYKSTAASDHGWSVNYWVNNLSDF